MISRYNTIQAKKNVIADDLSKKSYGMVASLMIREWQALETMVKIGVQSNLVEDNKFLGCFTI